MKLVDTHNHLTGWSPDAEQTFGQLTASACERGLLGFAVSDHFDLDVTAEFEENPWVVDIPAYFDTFYERRRMPSRRKESDPPGFLLSLELGWTRQNGKQLQEINASYPFDYTIAAVHFYNGYDPYSNGEHIYTEKLGRLYSDIIGLIAQSAEELAESRIIAHYDFFSRYAPQKESKMTYRHAPDEFDALFRTMRENEQILEINTRTIDALHRRTCYSLEEAMPDADILRRYRELGGRFLTVASDAHSIGQNGHLAPETVAYLNSLGFHEFAWFEDKKLHYSRV